jgi:type VI secretion system secreted protein VgrG
MPEEPSQPGSEAQSPASGSVPSGGMPTPPGGNLPANLPTSAGQPPAEAAVPSEARSTSQEAAQQADQPTSQAESTSSTAASSQAPSSAPTSSQLAGRPASEADFTFQVADKTPEDLKVTGFSGDEEISRLFSFRVEFCSDDSDIAFDDIVGKPCVLEIHAVSGSRYVNGIVRRFERTGEGSSLTYYAAEVVPVHWLLTKRYKSRIFQEHNCSDMTIPGIVKKVFDDAGIPSDNYRFALQGDYDTREYVVQYRESEMSFISRLMEEEGIFFFFEHTADGHTMVIGDNPVAHTETPNESEFAFRDPTGLVTEQEQEFVYNARDGQEVQTGAVALDDYNYKQPRVDLMATTAAEQYTSLEFSDYPGEYTDKPVGDRYAGIRLEEFQCQRRVQQMEANVRALLPGYKFTLREHPTESVNREYLVTRLVHTARQPQSAQEEAGAEYGIEYKAEVRTIPSDVPFRPPRVTPRPVVRGTQTAVVVGPSGEEIYTDKYGRVKVQYFWDREGVYDENSSRWTRVSQGSAGGQYGMMFLPRVGQEVVVDFLEGDPDRPLVVGRVYNNDQMPPYSLPDEKTKSCIKTHSSKGGGGTNEIRFEDKKGSEQILVYAQNNLHIRANTTRVENIGKDRHLTVKENKFELVKMNSNREVTLDLTEKIGGKKSLEVAGDVGEDVKGSHSEKVGTNFYLNATTNLVLEAGTNITLKVGGNSIALTSAGIFLSGSMVYVNSGSGATSGSTIALKAVEAPIDADSAVPGKDVTYTAQPQEYEPLEEEEERETSWVEIEMVDEAGQPWSGEYYEVTLPDGKVKKGYLDSNGQAHVPLPKATETQVSFPRLDQRAWEKIQ